MFKNKKVKKVVLKILFSKKKNQNNKKTKPQNPNEAKGAFIMFICK